MNKTKKLALVMGIIFTANLMLVSMCYAATATVTTDTLRVRKAPTTDSNILRTLDMGATVEVLETSGDWYKITYEGYAGYIAKDYVKLTGEISITHKHETKQDSLNVNTK